MPLGFLCWSQHMYCVDFIENTLFKSYGDICWSSLPSLLLDQLSMDKRDSDGFFLRRLACSIIIVCNRIIRRSCGYSRCLVLHSARLAITQLHDTIPLDSLQACPRVFAEECFIPYCNKYSTYIYYNKGYRAAEGGEKACNVRRQRNPRCY